MRFSLWLLLAFAVFQVSCGSGKPPRFYFKDVGEFPTPIQNSSRAVGILIFETLGGTFSFISNDGLILTNDHVAGRSACPREGCYVRLSTEMQNGIKARAPEKVFLEPLARDKKLDVAILQVWKDANKREKYSSPNFLDLRVNRNAEKGLMTYLVGHPGASLKKGQSERVREIYDDYQIETGHCAIGGVSGSPMLDGDGRFVGIAHSGECDSVSEEAKPSFLIFTKAEGVNRVFDRAGNGGGKSDFISLATELDASDFKENNSIYLNSRTREMPAPAGIRSVPERLYEACDGAVSESLDSRSPLHIRDKVLRVCLNSIKWLSCRGDKAGYQQCPAPESQANWQKLFDRVWTYIAHNGGIPYWDELRWNNVSSRAFSTSQEDGDRRGQQRLSTYLQANNRKLDFRVGSDLLSLNVFEHAGTSLISYFLDYKKDSSASANLSHIVDAHVALFDSGKIPRAELLTRLRDLETHPDIKEDTRLDLENERYWRQVEPTQAGETSPFDEFIH